MPPQPPAAITVYFPDITRRRAFKILSAQLNTSVTMLSLTAIEAMYGAALDRIEETIIDVERSNGKVTQYE